MRPTKKCRASSNKIRKGVDEKLQGYFRNIGKSFEPRGKLLQYTSLGDVPLEARRREAKKPMYLIRYE